MKQREMKEDRVPAQCRGYLVEILLEACLENFKGHENCTRISKCSNHTSLN